MKLTRPEFYERVVFLGENGSGKSEMALELLQYYDEWVIFDTKHDTEPRRTQKYTVISTPSDVRWKWAKRILYRPAPEYNNGVWLEEMTRRMYIRGQKTLKKKKGIRKPQQTRPFILYIDEALMYAKLSSAKWLANHAVAGRSLGIGLWVSSQRPKWIPVEVRSEAWRIYIFNLGYEEDEKEIVKVSKGKITVDELHAQTGDYSFYEIRRIKGGNKQVSHFPPMRLSE